MTGIPRPTPPLPAATIFDRVVCGVEGSDAGIAAARAAARVASTDGSLTLVSVEDPSLAVHAGWRLAHVAEELAGEAETALERAAAEATPGHPVETRLVAGDPVRCLLAEVEQANATLLVVGSHGHGRAAGIALGSVTTYVLHEAPCAVLVARVPVDFERWPRSLVVGVDGSPESEAAWAAAEQLAGRFGSELRAVVATGDGGVDLDAARRVVPEVEDEPARAVDLLSVLSERADLVVVGGRGLHGLRALGSVSERVAHEARSSVLVVRTP